MAVHRIAIFGPTQKAAFRNAEKSLRFAPTVKNNVFSGVRAAVQV